MSTASGPCCEGDILPGTPIGTITEQGAYFVAGSEPSNRAVVYITDAFGLPLKNCKIIADNISKSLGCDVWVPDIFNGRPILGVDQLALPVQAGVRLSWWETIKILATMITRLPVVIMNRPSVVDARIDKFINNIREVKKYDKIGAIGYCFGGACAARLGAKNLVDSIVVVHPGGLSLSDVGPIRVPASWANAEDDQWFPTDVQQKAEAIFAERKGKENFVEYEFKQWKGTAHGFAARPVMSIPDVKAGYEGAFEQAVDWFNKTIPANLS